MIWLRHNKIPDDLDLGKMDDKLLQRIKFQPLSKILKKTI
jgi:hypothetical protein